MQRDIEVFRESLSDFKGGVSSAHLSSSSLNDMESIVQGLEDKIQQLQHEL